MIYVYIYIHTHDFLFSSLCIKLHTGFPRHTCALTCAASRNALGASIDRQRINDFSVAWSPFRRVHYSTSGGTFFALPTAELRSQNSVYFWIPFSCCSSILHNYTAVLYLWDPGYAQVISDNRVLMPLIFKKRIGFCKTCVCIHSIQVTHSWVPLMPRTLSWFTTHCFYLKSNEGFVCTGCMANRIEVGARISTTCHLFIPCPRSVFTSCDGDWNVRKYSQLVRTCLRRGSTHTIELRIEVMSYCLYI